METMRRMMADRGQADPVARRDLQSLAQMLGPAPFLMRNPQALLEAATAGDWDLGAEAELGLPAMRAPQGQPIGRKFPVGWREGAARPEPSVDDLRVEYGVPDGVDLTRVDFQVLRRLEGYGLDRQTTVGVYLACDRNEGIAANCLIGIG